MKKTEHNIKNISNKKTFLLCTAMLILFNNCVEEITFNDTSFDKLLVINATITDEYKIHEVTLSRISTLNAVADIDNYEKNAVVSILEDSQITHLFQEKTNGIYESIMPFKAELGKRYSLHITTTDGEIYESSLEEIQGVNDIDEVYAEPGTDYYGTEGITIYAKSESSDKKAKYYKYTYKETYKIIAPYFTIEALRIVSDVPPYKVEKYYHNEERQICYNTIASINILQAETNSLSKNIAVKPIRFIKKNDSIIAHRYSIEVKQQVQSYEAYTYYSILSKFSTSESVFSQTQQGFLQGNMVPTVNKNNKVVGYFEVNSVSKKRIFFNITDVFPDQYINTRKSCDTYAPKLIEANNPFSPLIDLLKAGFLYYEENGDRTMDNPGPYKIVQKRCGDCRVNGSIVKPNFWID